MGRPMIVTASLQRARRASPVPTYSVASCSSGTIVMTQTPSAFRPAVISGTIFMSRVYLRLPRLLPCPSGEIGRSSPFSGRVQPTTDRAEPLRSERLTVPVRHLRPFVAVQPPFVGILSRAARRRCLLAKLDCRDVFPGKRERGGL